MRIVALIALTVVTLVSSLQADEIVITRQRQTAGDFSCSPFSNKGTPRFDIVSGEISAGALWKFFDSQGSKSIHQLTLCLDLDSLDHETNFGLDSVQLKIEDPRSSELLTDVSLGEDLSLIHI